VGDGVSDHAFWGRPENMDTKMQERETFVHNKDKPCSDLAGEMSACLSATAKAFKMWSSGFDQEIFDI